MQRVVKANLFALLFLVGAICADDKITVYNKSPRDVYVAIYYADDDKANRMTPLQFIEASVTATMQRPERKYKGISLSGFFYDRELVFVEDSSLLKDTLTRAELNQYRSLNIGNLKGSTFYITAKDAVLVGYNRIEWTLIKDILEDTVIKTITKLFALYTNPYHKITAHVRIGNH